MLLKNYRHADKEIRNHFSIRKMTIGACSVLIGVTLWMGVGNQTVMADNVDGGNGNVVQSEEIESIANDETQGEAENTATSSSETNVQASPGSTTSSDDDTSEIHPDAESESQPQSQLSTADPHSVSPRITKRQTGEKSASPATSVDLGDSVKLENYTYTESDPKRHAEHLSSFRISAEKGSDLNGKTFTFSGYLTDDAGNKLTDLDIWGATNIPIKDHGSGKTIGEATQIDEEGDAAYNSYLCKRIQYKIYDDAYTVDAKN